MGITASGVGSGLDINGLVSQLVSAESKPLNQIKSQEKTVSAKISAYGQLSSAVAAFQTAVKSWSTSGLSSYSASSSSTGTISATASGSAAPGSYNISVTQIAQAQRLCSPGFADSSSTLGGGTLAIAIGGGAPVMLTPASNSLQDLADAINSSGLAVSASILNDGGSNGMHLVVSSNQTGAASPIALTGTGVLAAMSFDPLAAVNFAYDPLGNPPVVMSQTQAAQDARFSIDGMNISAASNTVTGAIQGVVLQLSQPGAAPVALSVSRDPAATKAAISSVAKAWNDLRSLVSTQTAWNDTTKTGATLHGDSGPASILSQLRNAMTRPVSGAGSYSTLNDLGMSFQKDGTLAVNDSKLSTAIAGNFKDLQSLLGGSGGLAARLSALTDNVLGEKGVVATRTDGLSTSLRRLGTRESAEQARIDSLQSRYRAQFTRLDSTLARSQGTSSYLTQQLASLAKL